eukprot:361266-Chlamydomonas_euryale.AAC.2
MAAAALDVCARAYSCLGAPSVGLPQRRIRNGVGQSVSVAEAALPAVADSTVADVATAAGGSSGAAHAAPAPAKAQVHVQRLQRHAACGRRMGRQRSSSFQRHTFHTAHGGPWRAPRATAVAFAAAPCAGLPYTARRRGAAPCADAQADTRQRPPHIAVGPTSRPPSGRPAHAASPTGGASNLSRLRTSTPTSTPLLPDAGATWRCAG